MITSTGNLPLYGPAVEGKLRQRRRVPVKTGPPIAARGQYAGMSQKSKSKQVRSPGVIRTMKG